MIDLHMHSTFSDGSFTPEELVSNAAKIGLSAIALTDHDGLLGMERFMEACRTHGIRGVPGVEISVDFEGATMHMLGYFLNHQDPVLSERLASLRRGREERNVLILERLNALGLPLTWEEVAAHAREDVVGRPHFAMAMIQRGYVQKKDDAFDRYLGRGKPAYVERFRFTVEESLAMIREAGGVSVLAHPFSLDLGRRRLRALLEDLAAKGLQGIEAYYPEHSSEQHRFCIAMAGHLGLALSGGSDFHGAMNTGIRQGVGFGNLSIPDNLVEQLYARIPAH